jgi:hypothetical protein
MRNAAVSIVAIVLSMAIGACAPQSPRTAGDADPVVAQPLPTQASPSDARRPRVVVSKNATCDCCKAWVEHMRGAGFDVEVHDMDNLDAVKTRVGVPAGKGSCHTAEVDGYFIEGHVPAGDVKRLLAERPHARGLVLPGMPAGSPGMELPDGSSRPYTVEIVRDDGSTGVFAQHGAE